MTHDHSKARPALDFWGSVASIACAIHCSLFPFIISLGMLSGWSWLQQEWVDLVFIGISVVLVTWSLGASYRDVHRDKGPLTLAIAGFITFGSGHYISHDHEMFLHTLGGLMIAVSHYYNWRLNKKHVISCKTK